MKRLTNILKSFRSKLSKYKFVHFIYVDKDGKQKVKSYKYKDLNLSIAVTYFRIFIYFILFSERVEPITNIIYIKFSNSPCESYKSILDSDIHIQYIRYDAYDDCSKNVAVIYSQDNRLQTFRFDLEVYCNFLGDFIKAEGQKWILTALDKNNVPNVINYAEIEDVGFSSVDILYKFSLFKPIKLKHKRRRY